jgi:hypothetical protein
MGCNMSNESITPERFQLIAPCGIDCKLCQRYNRGRNPCPGCRGDDYAKLPSCLSCNTKNCEHIRSGKVGFCSECSLYPCKHILHLDKRYKSSYGISVIENLNEIRDSGLRNFVLQQERRWSCTNCGEVLCMHKSTCLHCGKARRDATE